MLLAGALLAAAAGLVVAQKPQPAPAKPAAGGPKAAAGEQCYKIGWTTLARSGLKYGSGVWGKVKASK